MPIKTEAVPVPPEEGEAASEQPEATTQESEEKKPKRAPKKQIPKAQPKRVSKKAAPQEEQAEPAEATEAATEQAEAEPAKKSRAKAKSKDTADLSQKTKCPICKRVVTTHCLLYTHKCPKAALDEKKKYHLLKKSSSRPSLRGKRPETSNNGSNKTQASRTLTQKSCLCQRSLLPRLLLWTRRAGDT